MLPPCWGAREDAKGRGPLPEAEHGREALLKRYQRWRNLPEMFFEQMARHGPRNFLWAKPGPGQPYRPITFAETADRVRAIAHGLIALGIRPGDRVALVSENRPEWLIADMGIMAAGAVSVPAYTTNLVGEHLHVFANSGARAVIVSTRELADRVVPAAVEAQEMDLLIAMEPLAGHAPQGLRVETWDATLERGRAAGDAPPPAVESAARGDLCCLIYTSGTGGRPKGVMLSHGALLCNAMSACDLILDLGIDEEVFLSFLPLSHAYEHSAGQTFPITIGAEIYYAESVETLARNMQEVRPTIMTAVPRLYETMHGRILSGLRSAPKIRRALFFKAVELGRKRYEQPDSLGLFDRLADWLLDRLVRSKVHARFGGRIKALVSGGAPLNYEIGVFFTALGVRLLQGYGQTETAPIVSCNRAIRNRIDTVGPPLAGVEVKVAEDGEILVRGELVMLGYWNEPEATAAALKDGWLHTGDVGEIDADGYIRITDRKKDIIVLSGGDTLSPQRVEGFLTLQPEIAQAMVVGDGRPYLLALIVPDSSHAAEWARSLGKPADLSALIDDPGFREYIAEAVERTNRGLPLIERVRRHKLIAEPFTTDNDMLTPTMKIRRHAIRCRYADLLATL